MHEGVNAGAFIGGKGLFYPSDQSLLIINKAVVRV